MSRGTSTKTLQASVFWRGFTLLAFLGALSAPAFGDARRDALSLQWTQGLLQSLDSSAGATAKAGQRELQALDQWDLDPANAESLRVTPVREDAFSFKHARGLPGTRQGQVLKLGMKHYARPGAQPILLLHGLAQNDRIWDSPIPRFSFARFLHSRGYDVWIGNLRNAGTSGYRSEWPNEPHHYTIDDYAIYDLPAMLETLRENTGIKPFVVGHSLGAWITEGYLAGLYHNEDGAVRSDAKLSQERMQSLKGVISIAGVHNLQWEHSVRNFLTNPILSIEDYFHSAYELELLAGTKPLVKKAPEIYATPLDWVGKILTLPLDGIPYIGPRLSSYYVSFQNSLINTPLFNLMYYAPNSDPDMVRHEAYDSLEDFGPLVLEQLANAVNERRTTSYYHLKRPADAWTYGDIRKSIRIPMLFVGGNRDRMASALQIYNDGYLMTRTPDKKFIGVEAGHLDIVTGIHAPSQVMAPVSQWIHERE